MEGADVIFSCGKVDAHLTADGAVHLREQAGGDLHRKECNANKLPPQKTPRDRPPTPPANGDDEEIFVRGDVVRASRNKPGTVFQALGGFGKAGTTIKQCVESAYPAGILLFMLLRNDARSIAVRDDGATRRAEFLRGGAKAAEQTASDDDVMAGFPSGTLHGAHGF